MSTAVAQAFKTFLWSNLYPPILTDLVPAPHLRRQPIWHSAPIETTTTFEGLTGKLLYFLSLCDRGNMLV